MQYYHSSIYTTKYVALLKGMQSVLKIHNTRIDICSDLLSTMSSLKYSTLTDSLVIKTYNI